MLGSLGPKRAKDSDSRNGMLKVSLSPSWPCADNHEGQESHRVGNAWGASRWMLLKT